MGDSPCVLVFSGVRMKVPHNQFPNLRTLARWVQKTYSSEVSRVLWDEHGLDATGIPFKTWLAYVERRLDTPMAHIQRHRGQIGALRKLAKRTSGIRVSGKKRPVFDPVPLIRRLDLLEEEFDDAFEKYGTPVSFFDYAEHYGSLIEIQGTEMADILDRIEHFV